MSLALPIVDAGEYEGMLQFRLLVEHAERERAERAAQAQREQLYKLVGEMSEEMERLRAVQVSDFGLMVRACAKPRFVEIMSKISKHPLTLRLRQESSAPAVVDLHARGLLQEVRIYKTRAMDLLLSQPNERLERIDPDQFFGVQARYRVASLCLAFASFEVREPWESERKLAAAAEARLASDDLVRLATERSPDEVLRLLRDRSASDAQLSIAAEQAGEFEDAEQVVEALIPLLDHTSSVVREGAVLGLAQLIRRSDGVRQALEKVSRSDPSDAVRKVARESLADS
jgi:hypothetical protein